MTGGCPTYTQNPGNVVAKMGHLNAAAELHRKGLEAKERTLGPDHPEALLVDLFNCLFLFAATFFTSFFACDMILAVDMNERYCMIHILYFTVSKH